MPPERPALRFGARFHHAWTRSRPHPPPDRCALTAMLDDIILAVHRASAAPEEWPALLRLIERRFDAQGAHVYVFPERSRIAWNLIVDLDLDVMAAYGAHFVDKDVWLEAAEQRGHGAGSVLVGRELVSRRQLEHSAFYNDLLRPIAQHDIMNLCLEGSGRPGERPRVALSLHRERSRKPFDDHDRADLARLAPHLILAVRAQHRVRELEQRNQLLTTAMEQAGMGFIGLDALGRCVYANSLAEAELQRGTVLTTENAVVVAAASHPDRRAIQAALNLLRDGLGQECLLDGDPRARYILRTLPMQGAGRTSITNPGHDGILGAIWLTPLRLGRNAAPRVAMMIGLTPAEARLLAAYAEEADLRVVSARLSVSLHTVRNQLKSILQKAGCRTQAQLQLLLARVATTNPVTPADSPPR